MSAFVVSKAHIDTLVSAAVLWHRLGGIKYNGEEIHHNNATEVGAGLLAENITSVAYRYQESDLSNLPGPIPTPCPESYRFQIRLLGPQDTVKVLKAIDCYEYQSCEHPEWAGSAAWLFCETLRRVAIGHLPGYDHAAWEVA
jgi:hypothetical protein